MAYLDVQAAGIQTNWTLDHTIVWSDVQAMAADASRP